MCFDNSLFVVRPLSRLSAREHWQRSPRVGGGNEPTSQEAGRA
jgi:hypothetical protein